MVPCSITACRTCHCPGGQGFGFPGPWPALLVPNLIHHTGVSVAIEGNTPATHNRSNLEFFAQNTMLPILVTINVLWQSPALFVH